MRNKSLFTCAGLKSKEKEMAKFKELDKQISFRFVDTYHIRWNFSFFFQC